MRIARVSLGAAARGMTSHDDVTSPQPSGGAGTRAAAPAGGRVYLRSPERSDREEFVALMRASRAFHRPWATAPTDDEAFEAYLVDSRRHDFEAMLACRREDRAILGFFNLSHITRGSLQSAYLGYAVGSPYAGHGYMREAIELVLREAFLNLRLHRIEANIQPGNHASIALARGAGFSREGFSPRYLKIGGRWRDHERWAILAEDWRARAERLGLPTVL
jgi:[ribosomal protein S5]-alanine N-acetyltransferase